MKYGSFFPSWQSHTDYLLLEIFFPEQHKSNQPKRQCQRTNTWEISSHSSFLFGIGLCFLIITGGIQIVRLVKRIPAGYQPFEEVVEGIRRQRSAETYEGQTRGLVEKLKNQYLVEVHQEYLPVVFANLGGA